MKTRVPIFITGFVGVFMILNYFFVQEWTGKVFGYPVSTSWIRRTADELKQWGSITMAFAIVLGILNIARINLKAVMERKKDWGYKLVLLISMAAMLCACGFQWYRDIHAARTLAAYNSAKAEMARNPEMGTAAVENAKQENELAQKQTKHTAREFGFTYVIMPLGSTIFSLLAFYIASAAFRAFRAKNLQATLLLVTALLVMIGRVPLGAFVWKGFPYIQEWLMTWPNTAGQRAILMGAAIGMIATGLRIIFGIERPYLKG